MFSNVYRFPCVHAVALVTALGATACTGGAESAAPQNAIEVVVVDSEPRFDVCGVDRTGSYDYTGAGMDTCARLIAGSKPGDIVVVRWISEASFRSTEFVTRFEAAKSARACDNPFDASCKRARDAEQRREQARKRASVTSILALKPVSAGRTDIMGFLVAAGQTMKGAPPGARKSIYMTTDLLDNVRYDVLPDLAGATVRILVLQTGSNPADGIRLQRDWERRLRKYGAQSVQFDGAEVGQ